MSVRRLRGSGVQVMPAGENAEGVGQLRVGVSGSGGSGGSGRKEEALCEWMTHQRPQRWTDSFGDNGDSGNSLSTDLIHGCEGEESNIKIFCKSSQSTRNGGRALRVPRSLTVEFVRSG